MDNQAQKEGSRPEEQLPAQANRIPNCVEITKECYAELKEQGYVDFFPGERIVRLTYVPDGRMFWNGWGKMIIVGKCDDYPIQAIARLNDVAGIEYPARRAEAAESSSSIPQADKQVSQRD